MGKKIIPDDIREKAANIVDRYNQEELNDLPCYFISRFQGQFLYLDRFAYGKTSPICCLKYTGTFDNWKFAIFKWSSESYDPDEFFFGRQFIDGTIEGAMKAGMHAYPV